MEIIEHKEEGEFVVFILIYLAVLQVETRSNLQLQMR